MSAVPLPVSVAQHGVRGRRLRASTALWWASVTACGFVVPCVVNDFQLSLLIHAVLLGIAAASIGFLFRYCGLVMFGVAAFIGLPAYLLGISATVLKWNTAASVFVALIGSVCFALLIGALVVRTRPLPFAMLTLALGQMLKSVATLQVLRPVTGGDDGLTLTFNGAMFGMDQADLLNPMTFWYVAWPALALCVLVLSVVGRSRFGEILTAIKANEERMRFSGFNTYLPRLGAFVLCCAICSLSGLLAALHSGFASPELLDFGSGGSALLAMLIGGSGSVLGPVVGALLYTWGQDLFGATGHLELLTGIGVIVMISLFPSGLIGLLTGLPGPLRRRWAARGRRDAEGQ